MRISDWSSDVCSSDLLGLVVVDEARPGREAEPQAVRLPQALGNRLVQQLRLHRLEQAGLLGAPQAPGIHRDEDVGWAIGPTRSEEHTSETHALMRTPEAVVCETNKHKNDKTAKNITS